MINLRKRTSKALPYVTANETTKILIIMISTLFDKYIFLLIYKTLNLIQEFLNYYSVILFFGKIISKKLHFGC